MNASINIHLTYHGNVLSQSYVISVYHRCLICASVLYTTLCQMFACHLREVCRVFCSSRVSSTNKNYCRHI